ncbi:MAG: hypothetical protein O3C67_08795 [Cyanobacteria bacterium]|nr:hypothetical protein [Cyanobacteriota bacterium]
MTISRFDAAIALALADELEGLQGLVEEAEPGDWIEDPLPLAEFMAQHMGLPLWPLQRQDLESFLGGSVDATKALFSQNPPTPYNCGVLAYGKGSGKDLIASAMIVWFVHVLFCLRSPKDFLEHEPTEAIDILLASPTLRQTRNITFAKLKKRLKGWKWLQDKLAALGIANPQRYLERATEAADTIRLPHDINIYNVPLLGANAEGFNTIAFILSEFAGMESDASAETATQVLNTFISSGKTRFNRAWKGFVASFPRSLNDPQEKIIEQHEAGLFPELFVVRRPTWEVHPYRNFDDFRTDFERDPEGSWAKYGAKPRAATEAFFRSPELIVRHASGGDRGLFERFFQGWGAIALERLTSRMPDPLAERDSVGDAALDAFGFPRLQPWVKGKQGVDYYCHIDIGLSRDSSGFAVGHLRETPAGSLPVLDLAFRWKPAHFAGFGDILRHDWLRPGQTYTETVNAAEIDLKTVTDFCIWLVRGLGFTLEGVTCDGFNSAQLMQTLVQADIPVALHVVDKKDYDELKSAIYGRYLQYRSDRILHHELTKLEIRAGKVDAPRTRTKEGEKVSSHKDLADGAAAVVARLCRQVAALEDFAILPEADPEEVEPESTPVEVAGNFSEAQQALMDEFFSS